LISFTTLLLFATLSALPPFLSFYPQLPPETTFRSISSTILRPYLAKDGIGIHVKLVVVLFPFFLGLTLLIASLLGFHLMIISRNQTTLEYKKGQNKYNKGGLVANIRASFFA